MFIPLTGTQNQTNLKEMAADSLHTSAKRNYSGCRNLTADFFNPLGKKLHVQSRFYVEE